MTSKTISDFTEAEFLAFVTGIYNVDKSIYKSESQHTQAVRDFKALTEHPDGSDLLYYPGPDREDSPEGVVKEVKEWRAANGKPGFKAS